MKRRTILKYGAAGLTAFAFNQVSASAASGDDPVLQRLYRDALTEGGGLVVWAGGSVPNQEDRTRQAFMTAFPGIDTTIKVRYSTEHSALIDRQLALGGLEPDVVQLQTLYDFDHWKSQNALLQYRPPGAAAVFKQYRDPDDTFIGISAQSFGRVVNTAALPEADRPRDAVDFLAPAFRDKIVVPDPTADDAVLFAFYLVTQKYGLTFMERFMEQRPLIVANSPTTNAILAAGERTVSLANVASLAPGPVQYLAPRTDQFMSWPRTAAIFRTARHPAAAKLYLAWQLSAERQSTVLQWTTRRDVTVPAGPITGYNTPLNGFRDFIRNRAAVERYRALITTFIHPGS
ncbi:ABC transporter substrate-binding protein [Kribbella antibiotica]|uniref:ABC transporter substrate-binding protein n=1 Tax=Kribbella antibiotica TaxID=190195 RepID=A0A4R4YLP9_9ACTN|nr:extracellular solute-binding protein [Kribbella antibiotica]TDD44392.1 ABC transporter substrate-binding protein [Kribbella antibiotica]